MEKIRKVTFIGAGAIGAAYASILYDYDPGCIAVLADSERYDRYLRGGFIVNGRKYSFPLLRPEHADGPADLIIVGVKYHHLEKTIRDMEKHVGPETVMLSIMNGISSEEIIGRVYGMEKMLYGMAVGIDAVREGNRITFSKSGVIHFGEAKNTEITPRVCKIKELFDTVGIKSKVPEDMLRALWWKFMLNVGVNQASAVLRAPYGVFQTLPEAKELMDSAMREVVLLSRARGIGLNERDMAEAHIPIGRLSPEGKTSMLQDIESCRKTEVEMFAGTVVDMGRAHGVPTPVNETLLLMIRTLEKTYPR
jgi:2-dehydropantoate 2-reductase